MEIHGRSCLEDILKKTTCGIHFWGLKGEKMTQWRTSAFGIDEDEPQDQVLPGKLTCPLKNQWLEDVCPTEIVPF